MRLGIYKWQERLTRGKDTKTRIIPKWEKGSDADWRNMHLDIISMLG